MKADQVRVALGKAVEAIEALKDCVEIGEREPAVGPPPSLSPERAEFVAALCAAVLNGRASIRFGELDPLWIEVDGMTLATIGALGKHHCAWVDVWDGRGRNIVESFSAPFECLAEVQALAQQRENARRLRVIAEASRRIEPRPSEPTTESSPRSWWSRLFATKQRR